MRRWIRARALGITATCAFVAATSCDTPTANGDDRVDRIVLTPNSATIQAGASVSLSAVVLNRAGSAIRDRKVLWASENEAIATVSQSGVVVAVAAGVVQIAASSGGKSARAVVTVTARPISLVRITPGSATISVTGSIRLAAEALDASGAPVLGRPITWSSSNETVALVSATGVVVGLAAGSVTITATVDGRAGTAGITVAPQPVAAVVITPLTDTVLVGARVVFNAFPVDAENNPLADRIVLWASDNPLIATVSSQGEVFALAVGTARIRATVEGKFADAVVLVQAVPVARVVIVPTQVTLTPGQTSQLTVALHDSVGNTLSGRSVAYATSATLIASVSATGLITAIAQGSAQIEVSSEGKTATAAVTVNPVPIASIAITPNAASVRVAQITRLVAQAFDAQGAPLANRTFTWSSTTPSVASVNQNGDVTAVAVGGASITASSEGQVGSATITVVSNPVASAAISPKPVSLLPSQLQQLTLALFDSAGRSLSPAGRIVTWVSRDPVTATVTSSGQVAGVAPGNTRVVVSTPGASASVFDSVDVTVSTPPIASLTVQPQTHAIRLGETRALRALITSSGSILRGRNVSWQSRAASIVTVTPVAGWPDSAAVVGVSLGSAYVVATEPGGMRDSSLISVSAIPVATVVVTPSSTSLAVNSTAQLSAVAKDSSGGTLASSITWVSQSPSVVSVSAAGLITANASGSTTIEARANGAGVNGADVIGNAAVIVTQPVVQAAVHKVTVTSARSDIVPGDTMHLTVVLRDAQNNVLTGRPITFSSSATTRMTVDTAGVVTGVATKGSADITATSEGKTGKIQLNSTESIAAMRVIGPTNSALDLIILPGGKKRYTVTIEDGSGKGISGQVIAIGNSNPSILTLSKTSITTGSSGTATVDISASAVLGFATITFTATRAGAIPPAKPGGNTLAVSLPIVVP